MNFSLLFKVILPVIEFFYAGNSQGTIKKTTVGKRKQDNVKGTLKKNSNEVIKEMMMGTGFSKKKKEAKLLQQQLTKFQSQLQEKEFTGTAGQGLVRITLTGDGQMKQIKINPECVDPEDVEGLELLIKSAYEGAQKQIQAESMPPGASMDFPFPGL